MQSANRSEARTGPRRRRNHQPAVMPLEQRQLLAIDLSAIAGNVTGINPPGPFGVLEAGLQTNSGVGWSVAEVGDVNGDGFHDMVVGAPTVTPGIGIGFPSVTPGSAGRVYLVLGSNSASAGPTDWLNITANDRIGDLGILGNLQQTNPLSNLPGFAFNGLTFTASQNPQNNLGTSVAAAGDVNGDGLADFLIGAPGSGDPLNGNPGTGRAYLIYGSRSLGNRTNKQVDLDNTSGANNDLNILTFMNLNQTNSRTGAAVAGIGDFITDGNPDIAIGAPNATVTGLAGQGAVYVVSGTALRTARTATLALNTVGQSNGVAGLLLAGTAAGDKLGYSLAGAGNTTGRTTPASRSIQDLLIGSPDTPFVTGPGEAVLFYGDVPATLQSYTTVVSGVTVIPMSRIGTTVPGAVFRGTGPGDATGYAVSTAGDFNDDGLADFLIGSPGYDGTFQNAGRATMIFGRAASPANPGIIQGTFSLDSLPSGIGYVDLQGANAGAIAGFSVTATGLINNDQINEIAVGSPGAGVNGEVYLIPGNTDLFGTQFLAANEAQPIQGLTITSSATLTQTPGPYLLGTSVSGNLSRTRPTLDNDSVGDLILGGSGFALNTSRSVAGGLWGLEGSFLPLPTPVTTGITTTIGVNTPFAPFTIDLRDGTNTVVIYVFSNATTTPQFVPPTDIDPTTIRVNGVAYPNAVVTTDPVDENGDGLKDAIVTITPRSALGLKRGTTTITITGRTLLASPLAGRSWSGTASGVTVLGSGGTSGSGTNRLALLGLNDPLAGVPRYGERFIPSSQVLTKLNWQRVTPLQRVRQFLPQENFAGRFRRFYHGPYTNEGLVQKSSKWDTGHGITTLGRKVFSRGQFEAGVVDFRRFTGRPVRAGARLNSH